MLIGACGTLLSRELDAVAMAPPEGTPLAALAGTTKGMARAYADDGATFFAGGDLVNALAAYYYGFGWLHFGLAYGLLSLPGKRRPVLLGGQKKHSPRHMLRSSTRRPGGMRDCSIPHAPRWLLPRNLKRQAPGLPGASSWLAPATRGAGGAALPGELRRRLLAGSATATGGWMREPGPDCSRSRETGSCLLSENKRVP